MRGVPWHRDSWSAHKIMLSRQKCLPYVFDIAHTTTRYYGLLFVTVYPALNLLENYSSFVSYLLVRLMETATRRVVGPGKRHRDFYKLGATDMCPHYELLIVNYRHVSTCTGDRNIQP